MGMVISKLLAPFASLKDMRILMLGLDAAGKTTILYKLQQSEKAPNIPTIGVNVESFTHKGLNFIVWDVGGQDKMRRLWKHFYVDGRAIIFVIDSNDRERVPVAHMEIRQLMGEEELKGYPLLVIANKQDCPNALTASDLIEALELNTVENRLWHVQPACATTGEGLYEGFDWLAKTFKEM
ncbi:putative ADP ribosylation factor 1 [Flagelloscypha sp. PMI_526]|nr:putative ADP ribosylation factor 1 [Flagelloscypha sp. PMI_526]